MSNLSLSQIHWLEGSLKAREDGSDRRIFTLQELDEYAHKALVPILWCINDVISKEKCIEKEHLLDHLGKAQMMLRRLKGLAKALGSANPLAEQFVPVNLLGKCGLNGPKMIESLKTGETEKLTDAVHEMASHAHSHVSMIYSPRDTFMKLSKYSCERYLMTLERKGFSLLHPKVQRIGSRRDGLLPLKLFFHK